MLHPVENHAAHRDLSGVGLSPGFGGNQPGQQVVVALTVFAASPRRSREALCSINPHRLQGGRAGDAVRRQAVLSSETRPRPPGSFRAIDAVHLIAEISPVFQLGLDLPHLAAGGPHLGQAFPAVRSEGSRRDNQADSARRWPRFAAIACGDCGQRARSDMNGRIMVNLPWIAVNCDP